MSFKLMLKTCTKFICFAAVVAALVTVGRAEDAHRVVGQLLVKPKLDLTESDFKALLIVHGAREVGQIHGINVRVLHVPEEKLQRVLEALSHNPKIEFAEPDFIATADFTPNDPYYTGGYQWHHSKIQSPQAWDVSQGLTNIIIGVLDTGVDANHPDLKGKVLAGYNYVSNTVNTADDNGHGTAVAGTAAASGNNGIGVSGIAIKNYILPVKVLGSTGSGTYSAIANGVTYAANKGARVINLSVGGGSSSSTLQSAIDYAWSKNAIIVAAAGNNANNTPQYPAACRNVVGVSATETSDNLASFSSYGSYVTLSAPGQGIWTTQNGGSYGAWSGTSFASPVTAGIAGLIVAANTQLSNAQVVDILKTSSDDIGAAGYDVYFGFGRVNANKAVNAARGGNVVYDVTAPVVTLNAPIPNSTVSGSVAVSISATDNVGVSKIEYYVDGVLTGSASSSSANFSWNTTGHADGSATVQARAYDAAGNVGASATVVVTVKNAIIADTTAPTVQIVSPITGSTVGKIVKVQVDAKDNIGVTRIDLYIDGSFFSTSSSSSALFNWNHASRGQHTLQAVAYDAAGNQGVSSVVTVLK